MVTDSQQNARILDQFSRQAASYASIVSGNAQDPSMPVLLDAVKPTLAHRVLDVGCGTGRFAVTFAPLVGQMIGVDLTPAMLDQARALQAEANVANIDWRQADVTQLPFADGEFDLVACRAMLHHVTTPAAVLAEMYRVCKPGGHVVAVDVMPDPAKAAAANAIEILRDPSHAQFVIKEELRAIGAALGLTEVVIHDNLSRILLEPVLRTSFPPEGMLDRVRRLYHLDARFGANTLGLHATFDGDDVCLAYPMTMMVWRRDV